MTQELEQGKFINMELLQMGIIGLLIPMVGML